MSKVLALTTDGRITYCTASEEDRGKGRCNHIVHQDKNESIEQFTERYNKMIEESSNVTKENETAEEIKDKEILELYAKINELAGEELTEENFNEVISKLPPEVNRKIQEIAFDASEDFSLPVVNDTYYQDKVLENDIRFTTLPNYGIAGKNSSIKQMYDKIGEVPIQGGKIKEISGNYEKGLTDDEYFNKLFSGRIAAVQKTVGVAIPGAAARSLFYSLSRTQVKRDCFNKDSKGIIDCKLGGSDVCLECLKKSGVTRYKVGDMIGGEISTHLSEGWYQAAMKKVHSISEDQVLVIKRDLKNMIGGY